MSLEQFLTTKNYTFQGMCGCRANKEVYDNGTGWQLWISKDKQKIEVRQLLGRDTVLRGVANPNNLQVVFEYNVNKYNRN